jgi:hypothetical protein
VREEFVERRAALVTRLYSDPMPPEAIAID